MKVRELIEKLQEEHIKFNLNLSVEEYERNGEEDFKIWLDNEIHKLEKD